MRIRVGFDRKRTSSEKSPARVRLVTAENISYIDLLQVWADFPQPEFLYRDRIHSSLQGNTKLGEAEEKPDLSFQ